MRKSNLKGMKKGMSRNEMRNVKGGRVADMSPECGEKCGNDDTFCTGGCNRCCGGVCSNG